MCENCLKTSAECQARIDQSTERLKAVEKLWALEADKVDDLQIKFDSQFKLNQELQTQLSNEIQRLEELTSQNRQLQSALQSSNLELQTLSSDNQSLTLKVEALSTESNDLHQSKLLMNSELSRLKDKLIKTSKTLLDVQSEIRQWQEKEEDLKRQVSEAHEDTKEIESRFEQALTRWRQERDNLLQEQEKKTKLLSQQVVHFDQLKQAQEQIQNLTYQISQYHDLPSPAEIRSRFVQLEEDVRASSLSLRDKQTELQTALSRSSSLQEELHGLQTQHQLTCDRLRVSEEREAESQGMVSELRATLEEKDKELLRAEETQALISFQKQDLEEDKRFLSERLDESVSLIQCLRTQLSLLPPSSSSSSSSTPSTTPSPLNSNPSPSDQSLDQASEELVRGVASFLSSAIAPSTSAPSTSTFPSFRIDAQATERKLESEAKMLVKHSEDLKGSRGLIQLLRDKSENDRVVWRAARALREKIAEERRNNKTKQTHTVRSLSSEGDDREGSSGSSSLSDSETKDICEQEGVEVLVLGLLSRQCLLIQSQISSEQQQPSPSFSHSSSPSLSSSGVDQEPLKDALSSPLSLLVLSSLSRLLGTLSFGSDLVRRRIGERGGMALLSRLIRHVSARAERAVLESSERGTSERGTSDREESEPPSESQPTSTHDSSYPNNNNNYNNNNPSLLPQPQLPPTPSSPISQLEIELESLLTHLLTSLTNLCHNSLENRNRFVEQEEIENAISRNRISSTQSSLRGEIEGKEESVQLIGMSGARSLSLCMDRVRGWAKVQKQACLALLSLCGSEQAARVVVTEGGASSLLSSLLTHAADPDIQRFGLWALRNMLTCGDDLRRRLRKLGVKEVCRVATENHAFDLEVLNQAKLTLEELDPPPIPPPLISQSASSTISLRLASRPSTSTDLGIGSTSSSSLSASLSRTTSLPSRALTSEICPSPSPQTSPSSHPSSFSGTNNFSLRPISSAESERANRKSKEKNLDRQKTQEETTNSRTTTPSRTKTSKKKEPYSSQSSQSYQEYSIRNHSPYV